MKNSIIKFLIPIALIVSITIGFSNFETKKKLNSVTESNIDLNEPFDIVMEVLTHKRCVNCHPAGDTPLQGEDSHLHNFGIVRGEDDHGLAGYTCNTCHQDENNNYSGVPGAPHWAVAPREMAWEGKTRVEIAQQMMDPKRNGGRSHKEVEEHLTEHELVLWAWDPGVDAEGIEREKPPIPKDQYIAAVKEWIENGAVIPNE